MKNKLTSVESRIDGLEEIFSKIEEQIDKIEENWQENGRQFQPENIEEDFDRKIKQKFFTEIAENIME